MTSLPEQNSDSNTPLLLFLTKNNLKELHTKPSNEGYELDDLKQVENDDLNNICKELNISTKHKLKLKNALNKLKSTPNVQTTKNVKQKVVSDKLPQSYALLLTTKQLSQLRDVYQQYDLVSKYITNASSVYENECKTNEKMLQNFQNSQTEVTQQLMDMLTKVLKKHEKTSIAKFKTFLDENLKTEKDKLKLEEADELQSAYNNTKTAVEILSNNSDKITPENEKLIGDALNSVPSNITNDIDLKSLENTYNTSVKTEINEKYFELLNGTNVLEIYKRYQNDLMNDWLRNIKVGYKCSVRDVKKWYNASIVQFDPKNENKIFISYDGWGDSWNKWTDRNIEDIRPRWFQEY